MVFSFGFWFGNNSCMLVLPLLSFLRQLPGLVIYSPNLYCGQAGATSGMQTAEYVFTECTVLFSLAQTRYPTYFARLQFFLCLT